MVLATIFSPYIPPRKRWLFPWVAGVTWFVTLFTMLVYWLANGRPEFPKQSNPLVAFISDIGAFTLYPFFIIGGLITAISFAGTISFVHHARYSRNFYAFEDPRWRYILSWISAMFGILASSALVLLTIFDTAEQHDVHIALLTACFFALALCSITTTVVWFDQTWRPSDYKNLRRWCLASNALVVVETVFAILFAVFNLQANWVRAGVMEWIVTFVGCAYLFCFVGYLWIPPEGLVRVRERQPLLQPEESGYDFD